MIMTGSFDEDLFLKGLEQPQGDAGRRICREEPRRRR
jgi:hypothetical protein